MWMDVCSPAAIRKHNRYVNGFLAGISTERLFGWRLPRIWLPFKLSLIKKAQLGSAASIDIWIYSQVNYFLTDLYQPLFTVHRVHCPHFTPNLIYL